jgi:excisionase family DNA binding protein
VKIASGDFHMISKLLNISELSQLLHIAHGTIYNWVYQRRIPFVKIGRCLRFDMKEIEDFLRRCTTIEKAGKR